jgi:hypothetical protein
VSANSRKGYAGERPIELLLHEVGLIGADRPRAGRQRDCGDFGGVPLVISAKNHSKLDLAGWVNDLESQVVHAGAHSGVVWHKKRGRGDPRDWYVTTSGRLFLPILNELRLQWELL